MDQNKTYIIGCKRIKGKTEILHDLLMNGQPYNIPMINCPIYQHYLSPYSAFIDEPKSSNCESPVIIDEPKYEIISINSSVKICFVEMECQPI